MTNATPQLSFTPIARLLDGNVQLLSQLSMLLSRLPASQYPHMVPPFQSSPGQHVRHIIEHYQSLKSESSEVNYDSRSRNATLEGDVVAAIEAIRITMKRLPEQFLSCDQHTKCTLVAVCDGDGALISSDTSLGRELLFLQSHTVHHMAILRAMAVMLDIDVERDFGVAPATLAANR